jgi:hypothetical protein
VPYQFLTFFEPMLVAIFLRLLAFAVVLIHFIRSGLRDRFEQSPLEIEAPENTAQAKPKNAQF